jgi:hypothetical protein
LHQSAARLELAAQQAGILGEESLREKFGITTSILVGSGVNPAVEKPR